MSAHLHADDPEVVLLAAPHQERLARVVEDAAPRGPEPARVGSLQKPVPFLDIILQKYKVKWDIWLLSFGDRRQTKCDSKIWFFAHENFDCS